MAAADSDLPVLVQTSDPAYLSFVRSLLESADIPFHVDGEQTQGLYPVPIPGFFHDRGLAAAVRVRAEDLEEAKDLLASAEPDPIPPSDP